MTEPTPSREDIRQQLKVVRASQHRATQLLTDYKDALAASIAITRRAATEEPTRPAEAATRPAQRPVGGAVDTETPEGTTAPHTGTEPVPVHACPAPDETTGAEQDHDRPLSPFYSHEKCGFHWHGRDGMDIPMRDGQPVCPRCELARVEKLLNHRERRCQELRDESRRRGKNVLEYGERIRALEREIDAIRRQLGAEILRANQTEAEPADRAAACRLAADAIEAMPGYPRLVPPEEIVSGLRRVGGEAQPETETFTVQVWPLARVLTEVRCGSEDWPWEEEWADLDRRHAETGYLAKLEKEIRANGITMPVLVGTDGRLWDGHHRLRIAVRLGIDYVPVEVPAVSSRPGSALGEQPLHTAITTAVLDTLAADPTTAPHTTTRPDTTQGPA